MPSTTVGAQSGGQPLVSGNPFSGMFNYPHQVRLKVGISVSGVMTVGYSGGLTISSGGGLASGGMLDGIELVNGQTYVMAVPDAAGGGLGVGNLFATVPAANSGMRLFWDAN